MSTNSSLRHYPASFTIRTVGTKMTSKAGKRWAALEILRASNLALGFALPQRAKSWRSRWRWPGW